MTDELRDPGPAHARPAPAGSRTESVPVPTRHRYRAARHTRRRHDRGSITAEFAVAMPAVVLLLLVGLTAVSAVLTQLECVDAARQAARAAARGDSGVAAGARSAPESAHIVVRTDAGTVHVTVRAPVRPLGGIVPGFEVSADAVAEAEPGVAP